MENKKIIFTTSWDDGYKLDIRIVELLEKYNIKGTFYVPIRNVQREVMETSMLKEISKIHEIGGHTVNHIFLNTLKLDEAKVEIFDCKAILQQEIGKEVNAFCYPAGKYSARDIKLVTDAGFLFGRTTKLFHSSLDTNKNLMHTGMQAFNHSSLVLTRHCLKNNNLKPILDYHFFYKGNKNFSALSEMMLSNLVDNGGVFHLWGHSWEIEKYGLWNELESVFKILSKDENIKFMNNTDCWNFFKNK